MSSTNLDNDTHTYTGTNRETHAIYSGMNASTHMHKPFFCIHIYMSSCTCFNTFTNKQISPLPLPGMCCLLVRSWLRLVNVEQAEDDVDMLTPSLNQHHSSPEQLYKQVRSEKSVTSEQALNPPLCHLLSDENNFSEQGATTHSLSFVLN